MVRLIVAFSFAIIRNALWFQFQNGSINSVKCWMCAFVESWFQFQNGSINSEFEVRMMLRFLRFNSKMVRLIARRRRRASSCLHRFNSKMVRLIDSALARAHVHPVFQFQNGSINSQLLLAYIVLRLEFQFQNGSINRGEFEDGKRLIIVFQFQNGSINRPRSWKPPSRFCGFNSKMVRLIVLYFLLTKVWKFVSIPKWFD